ncbi:unnamed protein product [Haemonchus placei]|uniref:Thioredoxin domain-containing protein 16 n=1 Tax=Haemonchus placei TaxID=6290 RepID=A0A0N4WG07_HAEPC|nr:unnamed protein product [Haemonchus placei]
METLAEEPTSDEANEDDMLFEEEVVTAEEWKDDRPSYISYADAEKMAEDKLYFMIAAVDKKGGMSQNFVKYLPDLNKELTKLNETLQIYPVSLEWNILKAYAAAINQAHSAAAVLATTIQMIETNQSLSDFKDSAYATVLFVAREDRELDAILTLARRFLNVKFGYVRNGSGIVEEHLPTRVHVFRKGNEPRWFPTDTSIHEIEHFIRMETHQPIFRFPMDAISLLPTVDEQAFLLYVHNSEELLKNEKWLEEIGNEYRGKLILFLCNPEDIHMEVQSEDYLDIRRDGYPHVRLAIKHSSAVYRLEDSFSEEVNKTTVTAFLTAFEEGKLKPYVHPRLYQRRQERRDAPLKTLSTSNYQKVVMDDSMYVLVLLYTARQSDLIPLLERIAEHYKNSMSILIAKMDIGSNPLPIEFQPVGKVPSLRLYESYTNIERSYDNDTITEEGIINFIEEITGITPNHEEEPKETATESKPIISDIEPQNHEEL